MSDATDLVGRYAVRPIPFLRRLALDAFAAMRPGHAMMALVEVDVTEAQARIDALRASGVRVSLFAFLVHAIAATLADHPGFNTIRRGRRVYDFDDVDVAIPVEIAAGSGKVPLQLVIRRAHTKSPVAIYAEIDASHDRVRRQGDLGDEDRAGRRLMRFASLLPAFVRRLLVRWMMASPLTVKRWAGTTLVTSVGKFATTRGFVIPLAGAPRATEFAIGGVVRQPVVVDDEIVVRAMQSLTVVFEHELVDGGPAARFLRSLQERIERAEGLDAVDEAA